MHRELQRGVTNSNHQPPPQKSPEALAKDDTLFANVSTWNLDKLRDSRNAPLARRLPEKLRLLFAMVMLIPLLQLAHDPDSIPAWTILLFAARLTLRQHSPRHPDWKATRERLRKFQRGEWEALYQETVDSLESPQPPRHQPDDLGVISRAEGLARRGSLLKAVLALEATPVSKPSPAVLESLRAKHPSAPRPGTPWPQPEPDSYLAVSREVFLKLLSRCENGVGAGPSGTTFEHLHEAALIHATVGYHLHALVNTILRGKLCQEVGKLLTASRLIALDKPDGGTRPIAIGECVLRLAAKAALTQLAEAAREFFLPLQFGVAVPGGAEAVIHIVRTFTAANKDALVIQADLANAFNSVDRHAIATALKEQLEPLLPLVHFSYGQPSILHLDAAFDHPPLLSETGVRQGDPLGPLLFAAAMQPALKVAAEAHPEVICLAYADDVTFLGEPSSCAAAFNHFTSRLAEIGLSHNPAKCGAWSERTPTDYRLPEGIPPSSEGLKVLGSYIGSSSATSAFVRSSLEAMGAPLGLIERMEPQLAGLLLSRCISRRVSYLARTTPLPFLPKEEWSEWGRLLLETLLTACGINHPRGDEETSHTWAQASLPISLGGLGLTDPFVEGSYSFLASYTQAQLLLDSLDSECSGPLEVTQKLMRGPYTKSSPLTEWLAEC
ncbi:unnamed protein product [Closterium sp. NIES-54]